MQNCEQLIQDILLPWKHILNEGYLNDWKKILEGFDKEDLKEFLEIQDVSPQLIEDISRKNCLNIPLTKIKLGELYTVTRFSSVCEQHERDPLLKIDEIDIIFISSVQFYQNSVYVGIIRYYVYRCPSEDSPNGRWSSQCRESSVGINGLIVMLSNLCLLKDNLKSEKVFELLLKKDKSYVSIDELYRQVSNFEFNVPTSMRYYPLMRRT